MALNTYAVSAAGQAELGRLLGSKVELRAVETIDHFYSDGSTVGATYACTINGGERFYLNAHGGLHFGLPANAMFVIGIIQEFITNAQTQ